MSHKQFSTRNANVKRRNDRIREYFARRSEKDHIRTDKILEELHDKHNLSEATLWAIIKRSGNYVNL